MRRPANRFQERPFPVSSNFQRGPIATTNLRRAILQVVDEFDYQLSVQGIQISVDVSPSVEAEIDGTMFCSTLRSFCGDAISSMKQGGELSLIVYADRSGIELEIADSRTGYISKEKESWLQSGFDSATHRSQDALADLRHFAATHGGSVKVQNCPEGGAAFTIYLPSTKSVRHAA